MAEFLLRFMLSGGEICLYRVQSENEVALIKLAFLPIIPQYILPGHRCAGSDVLRR